jgi:dTDP-4-dehydrorhamnose 3,5-epimerase
MRLVTSPLPGVGVLELDPLEDERGWFARALDVDELKAWGLELEVVQCNISFSPRRGTLRGMHYQAGPHGEAKLVRCIRGATFHVAVDLRSESPTYRRWHAATLSTENRCAMYLPPGVAHGCQTLMDDCEVLYLMGERYVPEAARGVRWDDPAFAISWPAVTGDGERVISERDASFPNWGLVGRESSFVSSER